MAYTPTTLSAAVTVTDTSIVVASATSIVAGNRLLCDMEEMTVGQAYVTGTTIPVLRGQNGTATKAHASGAGLVNGIGAADFPDAGAQQMVSPPRVQSLFNAVDLTATGTTGTSATSISAIAPCIVSVTGSTGGIGLQTGAALPGAAYVVFNNVGASLNIYAVGGTINGTTGTTAFSLTSTGNKMAVISCTEAGKWLAFGNT